jgi:aryl-alcohol dehydrogenase-like predicted oxidoreductase
MLYGNLTDLSKPVSRLVLGSMVCSTDRLEDTFALLDAWTEAGGNTIDTAKVYGEKSERSIGQWMQARGNREKIVLIGKGAHPDHTGPRVNPDAIRQDIGESLEKFQTGHMDIYLLHRDDPSVPVGPIVECLNAERAAGRIGLFGGSNWTTARIQEASDYAAAHGLQGFSASSPYFGLAAMKEPIWGGCLSLTAEDRAWHLRHQFPLFPWSSQARGFFTGRYSPEETSSADMVRVFYSDGNWERLRRARELAAKKGCSANNIALAYVLHQPFPVFPLIGPANVGELKESLYALDVALTDEEAHWLNLETD